MKIKQQYFPNGEWVCSCGLFNSPESYSCIECGENKQVNKKNVKQVKSPTKCKKGVK